MEETNTNYLNFDDEKIDEDDDLDLHPATIVKNVEKDNDDEVIISKSKIALIKKLLGNIKENYDRISQILPDVGGEIENISIGQLSDDNFNPLAGGAYKNDGIGAKIIEGIFDGENMIGPDGKRYNVPVNYASKSKMIEGDILKLTIMPNGTFVYKQICPIDRDRVIGRLEKNSDGSFFVESNGRKWRVLTASVTYYKGEYGDEAVVLIPKIGESKWAAVDNVVKKHDNII